MSSSTSAPGAAIPDVAPSVEEPGFRRVRTALRILPPIWIVFALLMILTLTERPHFVQSGELLILLKQAAPLVILAVGQLFVILVGEFDLSMGAVVTVTVIVAARDTQGDPHKTYPVMLLLLGLGVLVGLVNGLIRTALNVPSFIGTLGMSYVLGGAVLTWTHGSPTGSLPENFRVWGRQGISGVPVINQLPYSVIVAVVLVTAAMITLRQTTFGRQVYGVGGNPRAAMLSGVSVSRVRLGAFVVSAVSAIIAGILLGGYGGVSASAGTGYEFQAISAVVLGGAVFGGGRGTAGQVIGGALTLQALFHLLNLYGWNTYLNYTVQGTVIIAAVAFAAFRSRARK